eukprot:CAMPEP_0184502472 /NCGR_PEP_ID=MMETSP0113_2-20130426/50445_1 /TAXON_ID=91329 /ORGANISM="Norrisiella sphaerica, Strain BC52" /LENGTH=71 /DNA_ID=CAMNT_0026891675 /DNA_START=135 /DNA_END=347 /DNA_ORIENTATION=+
MGPENLSQVAERCIMSNGAYEIWAKGKTHGEAASELHVPKSMMKATWKASPVLLGKRRANMSDILEAYRDT